MKGRKGRNEKGKEGGEKEEVGGREVGRRRELFYLDTIPCDHIWGIYETYFSFHPYIGVWRTSRGNVRVYRVFIKFNDFHQTLKGKR